jgi:hypothetical protein
MASRSFCTEPVNFIAFVFLGMLAARPVAGLGALCEQSTNANSRRLMPADPVVDEGPIFLLCTPPTVDRSIRFLRLNHLPQLI